MLPGYLSKNNILIYAVLAILDPEKSLPKFNLNNEVESVFWTPLEGFLTNEKYKIVEISTDFHVHVFFVNIFLCKIYILSFKKWFLV